MSNRYIILENRALLSVTGEEAHEFLQGLVTQDVTLVTENNAVYSALLNAQGKYLHDFFILSLGKDVLWLECDARRVEHLQRLLTLYKLRAKVQIENISARFDVLAALGEVEKLDLVPIHGRVARHAEQELIAFVDPRTAQMGARIIAPKGNAENWVQQRGFNRASTHDYEALRISLVIPQSGDDNIPEKTLVLENRFEALHGVSFTKGCYIGQEVTARTKHRANLNKQLYRIEATAPLQSGTPILQGEREVGEVRSVLGKTALAIIRNDAVQSGETLLAGEAAITVLTYNY